MPTDTVSPAPSSEPAQRLADASLPGTQAELPAYDRSGLSTGIVHIGVGGFHRAHQAVVMDDLLAQGGHDSWAITGLGALAGDSRMRDALNDQDGLYTLAVKHPDGHRDNRVIGSIRTMAVAPEDPAGAVELMADPATRIVSLTITEGGYYVDAKTDGFDAGHPDMVHDAGAPDAPRTVFGMILAALRARRAAGHAPFTVLSCDNLPANGRVVARLVREMAARRDRALADWIAAQVAFPSSMVDRIVPAATDTTRAGRLGSVAPRYAAVTASSGTRSHALGPVHDPRFLLCVL